MCFFKKTRIVEHKRKENNFKIVIEVKELVKQFTARGAHFHF